VHAHLFKDPKPHSFLPIDFIMKPEPRQSRTGDVERPPPRTSSRVAEQKRRPRKLDTRPEKPLAPKTAQRRTTEQKQKQKPPRSKKPAPAKAQQLAKKKDTKPKPPKPVHVREIRKGTLHKHERRTANDPLPPDLATVRRTFWIYANVC
jgi:hypothetical protein